MYFIGMFFLNINLDPYLNNLPTQIWINPYFLYILNPSLTLTHPMVFQVRKSDVSTKHSCGQVVWTRKSRVSGHWVTWSTRVKWQGNKQPGRVPLQSCNATASIWPRWWGRYLITVLNCQIIHAILTWNVVVCWKANPEILH